MRTSHSRAAVFAAAFVTLIAVGCSSTPSTPSVTPSPPSVETETPTSTPAPTEQPTAGTREAPLALGESRKLAEDSAWIVGIEASNLDAFEAIRAADEWHDAPSEGMRFITATVSIGIDGPALEAQGVDIANDGAVPGFSVVAEYVGSSGQSYGGGGSEWCYTDNMLTNLDPTYDAEVVTTGDVCVVIPEDEIEGGLWRLSNSRNDAVWTQNS